MPLTRLRSCPRLPWVNEPAVGLEKVRGASSLIVWDISTFTFSLDISIIAPNNVTSFSPRLQPEQSSSAMVEPSAWAEILSLTPSLETMRGHRGAMQCQAITAELLFGLSGNCKRQRVPKDVERNQGMNSCGDGRKRTSMKSRQPKYSSREEERQEMMALESLSAYRIHTGSDTGIWK